jgi:hypothetical protein
MRGPRDDECLPGLSFILTMSAEVKTYTLDSHPYLSGDWLLLLERVASFGGNEGVAWSVEDGQRAHRFDDEGDARLYFHEVASGLKTIYDEPRRTETHELF